MALRSRKRLCRATWAGLARPSREALTKTFATCVSLGPSPGANVFVRATWPGLARPSQEALTKTFATSEGLGPSQVASVIGRGTWPGLAGTRLGG